MYSHCTADCRDANSIRIYAFVYSNTGKYKYINKNEMPYLFAALEINHFKSAALNFEVPPFYVVGARLLIPVDTG